VNRLNWLFTATSLAVVLVTIERFSPTVAVLLPPHDFLRLHEVVQMSVLILLTVIIPALQLWELSGGAPKLWAFAAFVIGAYFYATGNAVHEQASFAYNTYCPVGPHNLCDGLFFNTYYAGNIGFFAGALIMTVTLLLVERGRPRAAFGGGALAILAVNAVIYSLTVLAYAGFDLVLVGLVYSLVAALVSIGLFVSVRRRWREHPFITYSTIVYVLGTVASAVVRLV
jgi:hypothetical protein